MIKYLSMFQLLLIIIYLSFISLGLPDSLLGSAWPTMYIDFNVPLSYAGIVSMIIAGCTIISSLLSDRLTTKMGTGLVTAISVLLTALALFGFSFSTNFIMLCLFAIPYGLGAGSVDAALNNYVALHYKSRHMSWLHCMWGVGASIGPYIMGLALTNGQGWDSGYRYIGIIQIVLTAILFFSIPLWNKNKKLENTNNTSSEKHVVLSLKNIIKIKGAKEVMICFFAYCALETTTGLWAASYLTIYKGVTSETAAFYASMFYIGITVGRAINGFLTFKINDVNLIRIGEGIILAGVITLFLPFNATVSFIGLLLIGLGCAPIYPSIIHSTPEHFGADKSQAIVGVQMASAYVGSCLMPPLFGLIADNINVNLLPLFLLIVLLSMILVHEVLVHKTKNNNLTTEKP